MINDFVFIKDDRDDHRRLGSYRGKPIFAEIGRRFGLTIKQVCLLSIEETQKLLLKPNAKHQLLSQVHKRSKGYVILYKNGRFVLFSDAISAQAVLKDELKVSQEKTEQEVKGIIGSLGKAKGRVALIYTAHDLRKVRQGDVLVAVTTNPDYVPAMRLCSAIVTDEGGITSHASIISREIKKPCIIGTKVATRVFKDGDLVEVDAERGIIRKL